MPDIAFRSGVAIVTVAALVLLAAQASAVVGDCNGTGTVEITDLVTAINVSLGETPLEACRAADAGGDGIVTIDEVLAGVLNAVNGPVEPVERCGDEILENGEQCDDGNQDAGDGCDAACQFEGVGVLDQHWSGVRGDGCGARYGGANVGLGGPFAQEFVPRLSAITTVLVDATSAREGQASALRLNIRRGTFDGPLLAWATRVVADPPATSRPNWVRFDLPAPVAVMPGAVFVYELVGFDGGLLVQSAFGDSNCAEREYLPGDPVSHGERVASDDFLFAVFGTNAPGVGAIDQAWLGPEGICGTVFQDPRLAGRVLAQTFRPAADRLGAIAVPLVSIGAEPATPATLTLTLREGSASGPALASVRRVLTAPANGEAWYVFTLSSPLPVTPGATYAIELTDSADRFIWSTAIAGEPGCAVSTFDGGEAFADGAPIPADFRFATYAPVTPAAIAR